MNVIKPHFLRLTLAVLLIIGSITGCSDDGFDSSIPDINFKYRFSLSIYNELNTPGTAYFYPNRAYGGIFIYYNSLYYQAFDAACPYEADPNIAVVDEGGIGTCPECGSMYNMIDGGSLISGPSRESLRTYSAQVSGNDIFITN